ncbi:MAG: hypothetical protein ACOZQL_15430 [Myxococcota bacterium]
MKLIRNAMWMVAGALALAACGPGNVGSRFVKSQPVTASQGAVVTVTADESPALAGTRLEIPAGALSADTLVTIELGMDSILGAELSAGPAVIFGPPELSLNADATLVLPVSDLGTTDDVGIVGQTASGLSYEVDVSQVAVNATRTQATFHLRQFGTFQARRRQACSSTNQCASGLVCVNGRCRTGSSTGTDGGPSTCPMTCPAGTACDPASVVCVAQPVQCASTMDCPTNFACINGQCQAPSTGNCGVNTCASGQVCRNGMCIAAPTDGGSTNPAACMADADCAMGLRCVNGVCRGVCTAQPEICNNLDDDCDGLVDEGCASPDGGSIVCGGFAGLRCPSTMVCVDDPNDMCDPASGGDCLGLCVQAFDGGMCPTTDPMCAGDGGSMCPSGDPSCDADAGIDAGCPSGDPMCAGDGGSMCPSGDPRCDADAGVDAGCPSGDPMCASDGGSAPDAGTSTDGGVRVCRTQMDCASSQACVNGVCR